MKTLSDLVGGQSSTVAMKVSGLRAGIRAASQIVLKTSCARNISENRRVYFLPLGGKERRRFMAHEEGGPNAGSIILSFFIGDWLGRGGSAVSPKVRKETRERIKEMAEEVKEKAGEVCGTGERKGHDRHREGKGSLGGKEAVISKAIEAGKEAYEKEKGKAVKRPRERILGRQAAGDKEGTRRGCLLVRKGGEKRSFDLDFDLLLLSLFDLGG